MIFLFAFLIAFVLGMLLVEIKRFHRKGKRAHFKTTKYIRPGQLVEEYDKPSSVDGTSASDTFHQG